MAINHPYLQNFDDETLRKNIDFALNNIDQFLTLQTPQERENFIGKYFQALSILMVAFNDRLAELEFSIGITLDSNKILNILQKISFYREFRESPFLGHFQRILNKYLESYPNEVTNQFIHIQPITPTIKYDKKTRKQLKLKLFGNRFQKAHIPSTVQPAIKIGEYTSTPKLYNEKEHIKTDKSRFYGKLFRTTDDFKNQDKLKARAAFEKAQNLNKPQLKKAVNVQEEKVIDLSKFEKKEPAQQINTPEPSHTSKLKEYAQKQKLMSQIKQTIQKPVESKPKEEVLNTQIKHKKRTEADNDLLAYNTAEFFHNAKNSLGKFRKLLNKDLKKPVSVNTKDIPQSKDGTSNKENVLHKLLTKLNKPITKQQNKTEQERPPKTNILSNIASAIKTYKENINDTIYRKFKVKRKIVNDINTKPGLFQKFKKGFKNPTSSDHSHSVKIIHGPQQKLQSHITNTEAKQKQPITSDVIQKGLQHLSTEEITQHLDSRTPKPSKQKRNKLKDLFNKFSNKLNKPVEKQKSPTSVFVKADVVNDIEIDKSTMPVRLSQKSYKGSIEDNIVLPRPENPLLELTKVKRDEFKVRLPQLSLYEEEFVEELIFELEKKIFSYKKGLFLDFSLLEPSLIQNIIKLHARYTKTVLEAAQAEIINTIMKYTQLADYLNKNKKLNDLSIDFNGLQFEQDFVLAQYISFKFKEKVVGKYFADYQLEKIFSKSEIQFNESKTHQLEDIPVKIFNINEYVIKDDMLNLDFRKTAIKEAEEFNIAALLSFSEMLDTLNDELKNYLNENSKFNLSYLFNRNFEAITYIAAEIFLRIYSKFIYRNLKRGDLANIQKLARRKFSQIAREFRKERYSESDSEIGLIRDLYFNLQESLFFISPKSSRIEVDSIIEEVIAAICIQIEEWRLIPSNFFKLEIRPALLEEKLYGEVEYVLDVKKIAEYEEEKRFEEYMETYIINYTQDSRDMIYENIKLAKKNPDYIQKIINIAHDSNFLKQKLGDLNYKIKYDINKEISLAKDFI